MESDKSNAVIAVSPHPRHKSPFNHFQQDQYAQEMPSFWGCLWFSSTLAGPWSKSAAAAGAEEEKQSRNGGGFEGWSGGGGGAMKRSWLAHRTDVFFFLDYFSSHFITWVFIFSLLIHQTHTWQQEDSGLLFLSQWAPEQFARCGFSSA